MHCSHIDMYPVSIPWSFVSLFPLLRPLLPSISSSSQHLPRPIFLVLDMLRLHRRHGQDLAPLLALELCADDAVDSGADGIARLVEQDAGVVVEADDGAVAALGRVAGADDDGVADVAALDLCGGGDAGHAGGGGAALFLDDDDDAITCDGKFVLEIRRRRRGLGLGNW